MSEAEASGNSSTPAPAASTAAPATDPSPSTVPVATAAPAAATPPQTAAAPAATPDAPLYTLPEDIKFAPEATTKFEAALKGKLVDGKLSMSPQDVADLFVGQAKDANARWQQMQATQDREWEAKSKARFTPAQLAAAEVGIGFLTSRQLANAEKTGQKDSVPFRDLAKQFKNHPEFVEAMRIVGESLAEDTFEQGAHPRPAGKTLAERIYPTKTN